MSDKSNDSETRLEALESRMAYQDHTIDTLNAAITEQWAKIDALSRQVAEMRDRLHEAEAPAAPGTEPPPPHY